MEEARRCLFYPGQQEIFYRRDLRQEEILSSKIFRVTYGVSYLNKTESAAFTSPSGSFARGTSQVGSGSGRFSGPDPRNNEILSIDE